MSRSPHRPGPRRPTEHGRAPDDGLGTNPAPRRRIVVVSASIGAGHDGAAHELGRRLLAAGFAVEHHDFVDLLPLGRLTRASYARQLQLAPGTWGWLLTALARCRPLTRLTAAWAALGSSRRVRAAVGGTPAVVVSTYPLASQALGRLRRRGHLRAPAVTFLTDMSVHPLWVAPGIDAHLALHEVAAAEATACGARDVRVTGPAVAPAFRPHRDGAGRRAARASFGLPEHAPLGLVVAGSWGVGEIAEAVADIAASGVLAPVVACGRNAELRAQLTAAGHAAIGWTDRMPDLVAASDVVIQNAGGLSSLEARACGVPVLTYRCLPGHGRTNAAALDEAGWARWVREPDDLTDALKRALTDDPVAPPGPGNDPADVIAAIARETM
ncbi:glycosyltransferase [Longispora sp. K20-0274]|uniref:MGDG synthase family glycosyltransferase n=1 Tax=Longispora sp. K20-0274 TaxID=3088255 RepID=UPI00399AC43A